MAEDKNRLNDIKASRNIMTMLWLLFILVGATICGILLFKVIFWTKNEKLHPYLVARERQDTIPPTRGDILDCQNRIIATSTNVYNIRLDCKIAPDSVWRRNVAALGRELSECFRDRTAAEYTALLSNGRKKGARSLAIKSGVSQMEILKVRQMPIFRKGRFRGGYIEEKKEKRLYPYGESARRTIGYVRDNSDTSRASKKGIEGACDSILRGSVAVQMFATSDFGMIPVYDPGNKAPKNGKDVRTTIDIDVQNIADEALRKTIQKSELIEKSCVIVLETATGAIKAMVNLGRGRDGFVSERDNYAVTNAEAPGSVFKGAVVMALLEDGYITTLDHKIPTFKGLWKYNGILYNDVKHVGPSRFPDGYVKVREAFEMSANNPFRQLICDDATYGDNPARFVEKVKSFGLFDEIDFDLKGAAKPFILSPEMKAKSAKGSWDGGTFPRMAIGYGMELSPLNIVTFYNAIANDGRMMKPYLIDAYLEDGKVIKRFKPEVMHRSICRKETSDTLKKAMSMVTEDKNGTAYWQLHGAVCPIAGKTGTAQRLFRAPNGKYTYNYDGIESQQGSFVGFFPVEKPVYTAIVVIWSKPSKTNFFGASYAAPVFREIADKIYCLDLNDD